MTGASDTLLKLIHDTKAVSIWDHNKGPVFWYAANVPGPFYVNTELVIGAALAGDLLEKITNIVAVTLSVAARAKQLTALILDAYDKSPQYRQVIAALIETAKIEFPAGSYDIISGGERRDWLFSIPFAREMKTRHIFLFKNKETYCEQPFKAGEKALHVADLINNAASYFDNWFPMLEKAQLKCAGTLCVSSRGASGVQRLRDHGIKTVTLNSVDVGFFEKSLANKLINQAALTEISTYFASSKDWATQYLLQDIGLFNVPHIDVKSFERLQSFFTNDPWELKSGNEDFFAAMRGAIAKRLKG